MSISWCLASSRLPLAVALVVQDDDIEATELAHRGAGDTGTVCRE